MMPGRLALLLSLAGAHAYPQARTLLLSPSRALATPRGWEALALSKPSFAERYDEVHCVGGGSLLLWLLTQMRRAPRSREVIFHGPVVLPTPESCAAWLESTGETTHLADHLNWRRQALSLGAHHRDRHRTRGMPARRR